MTPEEAARRAASFQAVATALRGRREAKQALKAQAAACASPSPAHHRATVARSPSARSARSWGSQESSPRGGDASPGARSAGSSGPGARSPGGGRCRGGWAAASHPGGLAVPSRPPGLVRAGSYTSHASSHVSAASSLSGCSAIPGGVRHIHSAASLDLGACASGSGGGLSGSGGLGRSASSGGSLGSGSDLAGSGDGLGGSGGSSSTPRFPSGVRPPHPPLFGKKEVE